jgi:lipopolysaccharide transport system permease protein
MQGDLRSATRRYVDVVWTLASRDVFGRRHASVLGFALVFAVPAAFLLVYGVVFSTIVPIKLRPDATRADYAFFLFAGLVVWNVIIETLSTAPGLYTRNAALVRKASFPDSALAAAGAASAWCHGLLWIGVFAAVRAAMGEAVHPVVLLAPIALTLVAVLAAGAAMILASLGALVREVGELVPPALTLMFFLSPVLYPAERLAAAAPWLVTFNPLAPMLELLRAHLLAGTAGAPDQWIAACAWSVTALALGAAVHRRAHGLVADLVG